ncbi:MAG: formate dehydrogenase subunit gamma [Janthinobacterium lividum]
MRFPRIAPAVAFVVLAGTAGAVELPQNRPNPDRAALEQMLDSQRELPPGQIKGFVHIPDAKAGVLVQPDGRVFRDVRTRWQPYITGGLIVVAVLAMAALYFIAGPMRYTADPQGRTIKRFTWFERFIHWLTSASFVWLSLTGLNLVFGRWLLEPVIGDDLFSRFSSLAKLSHNSVGFAFMAGLFVMAVQWLHPNIPTKLDLQWIKAAGGMFGGPHPPARKFNFGQKMIYWIAVFGGGAISITGVALLVPFAATGVLGMQLAHGVHSIIAALMMAVIIGHIYLGSVGVKGSLQAMTTGRVDRNWAYEHHGLWAEEAEAEQHGTIGPAPVPHPAE